MSNVQCSVLPSQAAASSIQETHGSLDLLINSTGILSIPNVIQPGGFSTSITSEPNVQKSASTDSLVTYLKPGSFCFLSETTLSKVQKSSLLLAYEVNAVGPILVIKVKLIASFQFSFLVTVASTFCLSVILAPITLGSELILCWSAHVAITEGWRSLRDRERILIGCKHKR